MLKALSKNENKENLINKALTCITKEVEKIHINRVKEILIKALNQQAIHDMQQMQQQVQEEH